MKGQTGTIFHLKEEISSRCTTSLQQKLGGVVLGFVVKAFPSDLTLGFPRIVCARCREQHRDEFFHAIFTAYNHKTNSSKVPQTK